MIAPYKAFLSCSFADGDKEIVAFFRKLLSAFAIESELFDYQEQGRIVQGVEDRIGACDCLVAIATKRDSGAGPGAFSDWVQQEITLAYGQRKPVAIFIEDGVQVGGLISTEERRQTFARDGLLDNVDKMVRFLFDLRLSLDSAGRTATAFLKHYIRERVTIVDAKAVVERCEVLLECLADNAAEFLQEKNLEDSTPGLSTQPADFKFSCLSKPDGVEVSTLQDPTPDPRRHAWRAVFEPPLKKGDRVRFAYKIEYPNSLPYSWEDLQERIARRTFGSSVARVEASVWVIKYPTGELNIQVDFPEGYELTAPSFEVQSGWPWQLNAEETARLEQTKSFTAERIFDKWSLTLKVTRPLQDHSYGIYYKPPKADPKRAG